MLLPAHKKLYETNIDNKLNSNHFKNAYADDCIKLCNNSLFFILHVNHNKPTRVHSFYVYFFAFQPQYHARSRYLRFDFFSVCCSIFSTKPKTENAIVFRFSLYTNTMEIIVYSSKTHMERDFALISSIGLAYCMDWKKYIHFNWTAWALDDSLESFNTFFQPLKHFICMIHLPLWIPPFITSTFQFSIRTVMSILCGNEM